MSQANTQLDPIVEILRLAYRRGLALRHEQTKESVGAVNLDQDVKPTDQIDLQPKKVLARDGN